MNRNQEMEQYMRPLFQDLDISVENIERELQNTAAEDAKFFNILQSFLNYAIQHKMIATTHVGAYITTFVLRNDIGFNTLFFDALRKGNWEPLFSHPLLSTKWLASESFWSSSGFIDLPIPLIWIVASARKELPFKFERYRLGQNPSKSMERPRPIWVTISFVRHAESKANAGQQHIIDPHLTLQGREQASKLGQEWSTTRINKLYLSNTIRTRETAEGILEGRSDDVEREEKAIIIEQDFGAEYTALLKRGEYTAASRLRTDGGYCRSVEEKRPYRTRDGESQDDVAHRAQIFLLQLIFDDGVQLPSPPEQASGDEWDGSLIDGIPHIVVVSHNLFLCEIFESLMCWEEPTHIETSINYDNTQWTRHLLRLDWPEDGDYNQESYRGRWLGLRLANWYKE